MPHFLQIIMFEHLSGVETSNFGEMKWRCWILAKRQLYKNECIKLWRAPFQVHSNFFYDSFLYNRLLAKVLLLFTSPKLEPPNNAF